MSAHLEPMMYSVELAGAVSEQLKCGACYSLRTQVLRQGSFVKKMHKFGWTQPGFFDNPEDEAALQHALARYHG